MSDKRMDDRAFAQSVGLNTDDLDWLVKDAPPVADDVRARIRRRVHETVAGPTAAVPTAPVQACTPVRRRWSFARAAAAAAVLLVVSGSTLVATSEAAQEKLKELFRLVPGFGIQATDNQTRVLASPLPITSAGREGVIRAVVAGKERTEVRMRITGLPGEVDGRSTLSDGTWFSSTPHLQPEFPAELVLPDGTRMAPYIIKYRFDTGTLTATFTFGALPAKANSVRLEVPTYRDLPLNVAATLPLVDADKVTYVEAVPVNAAPAKLHGVKVEAFHYGLEGDLVRLNLGVAPATPETMMGHTIRTEYDWARLTDNNGHTYPMSVEDSDRLNEWSKQFNVAFAGPLKEGAKELTLTVPKVYLVEKGSVPYELNVANLAVGASLPLNQPLQVGNWPVVIQSVTRTKSDQFIFTIGLGKPVGNKVLSHLFALTPKTLASNGMTESGVQTARVDIEPTDGVIKFEWTKPTVAVTGPWVVKIPLR